ncbi:MAG: DUF2188 domain-containing protein [Bacilli bacterium]|nr:DUF2188 domain-containing protein [Bacilli bacterium]
MKKGRMITSIILNLLTIGAAVFGILNAMFAFVGGITATPIDKLVQYFTVDSNALLAFASLLAIIAEIAVLAGKKSCRFVGVLRLIATTATTVTLIVVVAYLAPFVSGWKIVYDWPVDLWLHVVAPVLGIISFIVDNEPKLHGAFAFLGLLPVAAYGAVMIPLITMGFVTDPYGFLAFNAEQWYISAAWYGGLGVGSFIIALLLIAFHNIGATKAGAVAAAKEPEAKAEEEKQPEQESVNEAVEAAPVAPVEEAPVAEEAKPQPVQEQPKPEPAPEPKPQPKLEPKPVQQEPKKEEKPQPENPAPKAAPLSRPVAVPQQKAHANGYKGKARAYHISKQPSGKWQVKLANGERAIRLFDTQAEAIAFTKGLVESQGGSYRIHSVKGKIRK